MTEPEIEYLATELARIQGQLASTKGAFNYFTFQKMIPYYRDALKSLQVQQIFPEDPNHPV